LSYPANTQTDRQTKSGKNITSLAEIIIAWHDPITALSKLARSTRQCWKN